MALSYNTNLANVVAHYLQKLNVKATRKNLTKQLEENPYFPSLYSINKVLDKYKIPNEAFSLEPHHLDELQPPFITYCKNTMSGKDFVLVTSISPAAVTYISNNKEEKKISRENFLLDWEKIILVAEPDAQSIEPGYELNLKREKSARRKKQWLILAGIALAVITIGGLFLAPGNSVISFAGIIIGTKLLGTAIAILLLIYETDKSNTFIKNLCSAGKQISCEAVLSSKASGIAGLTWSEIGFFYFAAASLFLFYPSVSFTEKIPWLAAGATLVSPYILFSLYYQYKVVKQWCPLCLTVQAVLLLELVWAIITYWQKPVLPSFTPGILSAIAISALVPVIAWFSIKPLLKKMKQANQYKAAYKRLLYNPEQFIQMLQQQDLAPDGWQKIGITIGNPAASRSIVKVCNPYCGPCAKAHPELGEIIHSNNDINLKIIFTATNNESDRTSKPVKHLLAIAAGNNEKLTQQALDDWYNADKKDYEVFAAKYPMNGELKQQDEKINAMDKWCREAGIAATPTIFIDGRALPENYNISELKNIL